MAAITVLHLVGSPTDEFYRDLSELYARACVAALADAARYRFVFAHVAPNGSWRFPLSLAPAHIAAAPHVDLAAAVAWLSGAGIDIALPQMFCRRGVADFRALLGLLGIPFLGNGPLQMAIAADKSLARAIVAAVGVNVPSAQRLYRGDVPDICLPVVVKPNGADNSDGVTLVRVAADFPAALDRAFAFGDAVLAERFVELGREVRCGVVERGGQLICLPLEEYAVDPDVRPIRGHANKLRRAASGDLTLVAKTDGDAWIVPGDDPIVVATHAAARRCYRALTLRQYGLFDFRIDPAGQPWFLEAGPYCSFAPDSVIVTMMAAFGEPLDCFFATAVADAIAAGPAT